MTEMGRTCSMYGIMQTCMQSLVGKPEGMIYLGKLGCRWDDNINISLREVGCESGDWIDRAEDRDQERAYVIAVMKLRVPKKSQLVS